MSGRMRTGADGLYMVGSYFHGTRKASSTVIDSLPWPRRLPIGTNGARCYLSARTKLATIRVVRHVDTANATTAEDVSKSTKPGARISEGAREIGSDDDRDLRRFYNRRMATVARLSVRMGREYRWEDRGRVL